jgi:hypothetical protein
MLTSFPMMLKCEFIATDIGGYLTNLRAAYAADASCRFDNSIRWRDAEPRRQSDRA